MSERSTREVIERARDTLARIIAMPASERRGAPFVDGLERQCDALQALLDGDTDKLMWNHGYQSGLEDGKEEGAEHMREQAAELLYKSAAQIEGHKARGITPESAMLLNLANKIDALPTTAPHAHSVAACEHNYATRYPDGSRGKCHECGDKGMRAGK